MGIVERQLADRQVSGLPISVATSLAIESACGVHPEIPVKYAPAKDYQCLYINIRTLIRNIHGAVATEIKKILTPDAVFMALVEELTIIESAISQATNGTCKVVYYVCSYKSIPTKYPMAALKAINSPLQEQFVHLETAVLKKIFDNVSGILSQHTIVGTDIKVEPISRVSKVMMLTHLPVDLLNDKNFYSLRLLESHTGAIKNKAQWNTKLTDGRHLPRIPFNRITLQVFGDNRAMFMPMANNVRNTVKELAEAKQWTSVTTVEKIIFDVRDHKDQSFKALIGMLK